MQHTGVYDPETIVFLRTILEEAWVTLPPARRAQMPKSEMAERILRRAAQGERDPTRLRAAALLAPVTI
jgi:hypothetical protein